MIVQLAVGIGSATQLRVVTSAGDKRILRAQSVERSRRRFPEGLRPTMWGTGTMTTNARGIVLDRFDVDANHASLGSLPKHFAAAGYACELVDRFVPVGLILPRIFGELRQCLIALSQGEFAGYWLRRLEMLLMQQHGWLAEDDKCSEKLGTCTASGNQLRWWDSQNGALRCSVHARASDREISSRTTELIRGLRAEIARDPSDCGDVCADDFAQFPPDARKALRQLMWQIVDLHLDAPLKSRVVMMELARA